MQVSEVLPSLANHLIAIMTVVTFLALFLRWSAYRACGSTQNYVKSLSRGVEKALSKVPFEGDVEDWMHKLFDSVEKDLPDRGIRFATLTAASNRFVGERRKAQNNYFAIKQSLAYNIMAQSDALRNSAQPNFNELSQRVLSQDIYWQKIYRVISVDTLQRTLAILPSLYIIGGILGTFIGISSALPMIGKIDLGNLDASGVILNEFINHIAYSMHTSIAGIAFSVAMTLLNTLFPLTLVRREVQNILSDVFENIWNEIHKDNIRLGERKIIELLTILAGDSKLSKTS